MRNKNVRTILLILLCWPFIFIMCWKAGTVDLSWNEFSGILLGNYENNTNATILFDVRLPRMVLAAFTGIALSLTGAIFQALFRNLLADPFVLGISGGAALGASLAVLLGLSHGALGLPILPLFAFGGALLSICFVYQFSRSHNLLSIHTMLLAGISLQAMYGALVLFIYTLLDPYQLMEVFTWLMGRIPSLSWLSLAPLAVFVILALIILLPRARDLNAIVFGDKDAQALGVDSEKLKRILFLGASLLTGSVVCLTGLIGFVGIVVPHILRLIIGPDHRYLLPACVIAGSIFMVVADTIARSIVPPTEIPVGVITAMTGGPLFLYLLWKNKKGLRA